MRFPSTEPCLVFLLAIITVTQLIVAAPTPSSSTLERRGNWPQWSGIEKLFVFGASYANVGFFTGPTGLPDHAHPWGTSRGSNANGPNFIMYLTDTFNASNLLTYDFAFPGAQVSGIATGGTAGNDLVTQVEGTFRSGYTPAGARAAGHPIRTQWQGTSSLFLFFFGINDLQIVYRKPNYALLIDAIFQAYETQLSNLYTAGARNFLLINIPPMESMPDFTGNGGVGTRATARDRQLVKRAVMYFNSQMASLIFSFRLRYPDTAVAIFDTHALFSEMQASLSATNALMRRYDSTPIEHLRDACPAYSKFGEAYLGSDEFYDESCEVPVSSYFWLNGLHPTWSVHKVMAGKMADFYDTTNQHTDAMGEKGSLAATSTSPVPPPHLIS
ncbi:MAG: hypothetical protein Q9169_001945 [Polycauliona sp. 2 TL-2023]